MKAALLLSALTLLVTACPRTPPAWTGPTLTQPRNAITVAELVEGKAQPLLDMSYFAQPAWATRATKPFSGTIAFEDTELTFPKEKEYYPGENLFPALSIDFITYEGNLIPRQQERISTRYQSESYWDVLVGTGKVWHEAEDQAWNRASFPLTLTDRWIGTARNCVATFVYSVDSVSQVCLQCSQETADINDKGLGNLHGILPATMVARPFADSAEIIQRHEQVSAGRLPVGPLSEIDANNEVGEYFEQVEYTSAPTSLGAVLLGDTLYLHPPKTRHGAYPYPTEMRHGLYSVTKTMAGALALMYFEERYPESAFEALITDYVPALADHDGWQGVTFSQTLNMVSGTVGGEAPELLLNTLILAETADEAMQRIAALGNAPAAPGEQFNYASTNLFVLSRALQRYVEAKEGRPVNYWDLVRENVLKPIGAEQFTVLHTLEKDTTKALPLLAYGALPTIDEAAKIALLFAKEGNFGGQQLLDRNKVREAFGNSSWPGYTTYDDIRGSNYQHAFWSKIISADNCSVKATYMLGFGANYVVFLPSGAIIFRFLDEGDLIIDELIRSVERIRSSCP